MARRFTPPPTDDLTNFNITDPASSTAVATSVIDSYWSVLITTTTTGSAQTIWDPTNTTKTKRFTVMNNDTSSDSITVNWTTLGTWEAEEWAWDWTVWAKIWVWWWWDLLASNNLSDVDTQQTAVNNVTNVSWATNEHVLTKDTGTWNAIYKVAAWGGLSWSDSITDTSWTWVTTTVANSSNASTTWISSVIWNTQSNATIWISIDTWTSSQANTGLSITAPNASTTASAINIDPWNTCTWMWINFSNDWNAWYKFIDFNNMSSSTWTRYWLYFNTVAISNGQPNYWIYMGSISATSWNQYWLYQWTIWWNNNWTAFWWYVWALAAANAWTWTKYFSLNNNQRGDTMVNRTQATWEIIWNRGNLATSWTLTDNFDLLHFNRKSEQEWAWWTLVSSGSIMHLENTATQTAWTLTDSVTPLLVTQDADSTWVPVKIVQNAVVSTNFKKCIETAWLTIWISDGTTAEWALTWVEWDICLNWWTWAWQMAYCDSNWTNWSDM